VGANSFNPFAILFPRRHIAWAGKAGPTAATTPWKRALGDKTIGFSSHFPQHCSASSGHIAQRACAAKEAAGPK
jgi:hypothetical protein